MHAASSQASAEPVAHASPEMCGDRSPGSSLSASGHLPLSRLDLAVSGRRCHGADDGWLWWWRSWSRRFWGGTIRGNGRHGYRCDGDSVEASLGFLLGAIRALLVQCASCLQYHTSWRVCVFFVLIGEAQRIEERWDVRAWHWCRLRRIQVGEFRLKSTSEFNVAYSYD